MSTFGKLIWAFNCHLCSKLMKKFGRHQVYMFAASCFSLCWQYSTSGLGTSWSTRFWFVHQRCRKEITASTCEAKALEPLPPAIHPAFLAVLVGLPLPLPRAVKLMQESPTYSEFSMQARLCHRELHSGTNKSGCNCRNQVPWALINSSSTLHY